MTAPAYQQPDQRDDHTAEEAAIIAAIALWLASMAAIRATLLPPRLADMLVSIGAAPQAARVAGRMSLDVPMSGRSRWGAPGPTVDPIAPGFSPIFSPEASVAKQAAAEEPSMRARYIVNAAKRLTESLLEGEFIDGIQAEKRNLVAHVQAGKNRAKAAAALDKAFAEAGPEGKLRWTTHPERGDVTPDCEALNGRIFSRDNPIIVETDEGPMTARPGMMHPHCHCTGDQVGALFPPVVPAAA